MFLEQNKIILAFVFTAKMRVRHFGIISFLFNLRRPLPLNLSAPFHLSSPGAEL